MPNWNEILDELREVGSPFDFVRRMYLDGLHKVTGRNVIIYYSGWLQASGEHRGDFGINDLDKIGFMSACKNIDRTKGLDLLLHTPGGSLSATESIIDYLHQMFDDIRVIVPQLAMSGGSMMACSARQIVMGKQSSLGPIDPQIAGLPAHGILEEFERAANEIASDPGRIPAWQPIIAKYEPTLIGECQKAIEWADEIVRNRLVACMLREKPDKENLAARIVEELGSHAITKSHDRHLSADRCAEIGLEIVRLESDQDLQEAVLSVHHSCMHTLSGTPAYKIIENHLGVSYINSVQVISTR
jgi:hypothetical protein